MDVLNFSLSLLFITLCIRDEMSGPWFLEFGSGALPKYEKTPIYTRQGVQV